MGIIQVSSFLLNQAFFFRCGKDALVNKPAWLLSSAEKGGGGVIRTSNVGIIAKTNAP